MSLRELRQAAGLTQAALAAASGVHVVQIRRMEAGTIDMRNITLANALRLAAALGVPPERLLDSKAACVYARVASAAQIDK